VQDSYLPVVIHPFIFGYSYVVIFTFSDMSWTLDLTSTIDILRYDITKPVNAGHPSSFDPI
jgi:hypothetical protein